MNKCGQFVPMKYHMQRRLISSLPPFKYSPPKFNSPFPVDELKQIAERYNAHNLVYYKEPVNIVDGKMQYLFDEKGQRYLDLFGGIVTVLCGHCHPTIMSRAMEQMQRLGHTTSIYRNPETTLLCKVNVDFD